MFVCECGHTRFQHGKYEWLRPEGKSELELYRVSDACDVTLYRDAGDMYGKKCGCFKFREKEVCES